MTLGQLDTTHDMYLPDKRAKPVPRPVIPSANGTREEREAWMRKRQAQGDSRSRGARIERVLRQIGQAWGVTRAQLLGRTRAHTVVQARGQACRELRKLDMSYPEIALALNLKQHTSVLYHCQQPDQPPPEPRPPAIGLPSDECQHCQVTRGEAYENQMGMFCELAEDFMHFWPEEEE